MELDSFVFKMIKNLDTLKYFPKLVIEGCYHAMVDRYRIAAPKEGKEATIARCIEVLNLLEFKIDID